MIKFNLIFTDEYHFVKPFMPHIGDEVTFTILTGKHDFASIYLIIDEFLDGRTNRSELKMYLDEDMRKNETSKGRFMQHDFYSVKKVINSRSYYYYKLVTTKGKVIYYNWKTWGSDDENDYYSYNFNYNFQIVPDWIIPEWATNCINYQIFVDRFCNGDKTNDVVDDEWQSMDFDKVCTAKDWNDFPNYTLDVYKFYNGDLKGILDKLDYLSSLGVTCLYLNPIFLSPSNHRYDTQDYDYIDPHIGIIIDDEDGVLNENSKSNCESKKYMRRITSDKNLEASNELFKELVETAHKKGIKIILDGVFNHCSSYHRWFDKGMIYQGHQESGKLLRNEMEGWCGFKTLPKLPYENFRELEDEIMRVAKKWVSPPYNADGWRLDVAAELGCSNEYRHYFWTRFAREVKSVNQNAIVIAEHYDDPFSYLNGHEWDSIMGYKSFMEPVGYFFTGMDKHCDKFKDLNLCGNTLQLLQTMRLELSKMPIQSILIAFNQISNHDHARFITRTKGERGRIEYKGSSNASLASNPGIYKEATIMMYTWYGMPTLYYGDEAGVAGWTDPDNRRTYPWGREDNEILEFHRALAKLCNSYKSLREGALLPILGDYNTFAYARIGNEEDSIILFNNQDTIHTRDITIDLSKLGYNPGKNLKIVFRTNVASFKNSEKYISVSEECTITVKLAGFASAIIVTC